MRKGKLIAQGSHAAMAGLIRRYRSLRDAISKYNGVVGLENWPGMFLTPAEEEWYYGSFRKICVYVNSEAELVAIHEAAQAKGLASYMIEDHGLTEFHGVLTKTCIAIGPCFDEDVDPLTGHLPLM